MASFVGHALPGTFLVLVATWWTIQTFRRYFQTLAKGSNTLFISTVTFPVTIRHRRVNVEAYVSLTCCTLVILVELVGVPIIYRRFEAVNYQHLTIYFFFALVPLSAIVLPKFAVFPDSFCQQLTYVSLMFCYLAEGLIFNFHLFNRGTVDVAIHTLLVYTTLMSVAVTVCEMVWRHSPLLPLARAFVTTLQGSWLWQAAVTLNNHSHTIAEDWTDNMMISCMFCWHVAGIFTIMVGCGLGTGYYFKKYGCYSQLPQSINEVETTEIDCHNPI